MYGLKKKKKKKSIATTISNATPMASSADVK